MGRPACLGKLPSDRDFLQVRASTPTMRAFDKWLRRGLHHARNHGLENWEDHYAVAPSRRFVFSRQGAKTPNLLLGILRASRDATGRPYPFIVTCEIPRHGLRPRHAVQIPVQARSFFDSAEKLVDAATSGQVDADRVRARVENLEGLSFSRTIPHEQKRYLRQTTTSNLTEKLFGHFQDSGKYRLFSNLYQELSGPQSTGTRETKCGLVFPLAEDGQDADHIVSFWSDVVMRLLDDSRVVPNLFWSSGNGVSSKQLLIYVDAPPPKAFVNAVVPASRTHSVVDLKNDGAVTGAEAALSIPSRCGKLLEQEDLSLREFLQQL